MTLVVNEKNAGAAQTHALIIGVGTYTNMDRPEAAAFGLDPVLTSPPKSASAFATFLADEFHNTSAPLGSIDLYLSGANEFSSQRTGNRTGIDRPTTKKIVDALVKWKKRAAKRNDNVAIFYFCGHGIDKNRQLGLLLSDFGAAENPMTNALDLTATQGAMGAQADPRLQCFFVDACRQPNLEAMRRWGEVGQDVLGWVLDSREAEDSSVFYATLPVDPAYGRTDDVSPFTTALLRALRGLGARQRGPKNWVVNTNWLGLGIHAAMKWAQYHDAVPTQKPQFGGWNSALTLHELTDPGCVPISIELVPSDEIEALRLCDAQSNDISVWDTGLPWRVEVPVGDFIGRAQYDGGRWTLEDQNVRPLPPDQDLQWEATWQGA